MNKIVEDDNYNIVGIVLNCSIDHQDQVQATLYKTNGVNLCAIESGKFVITIDEVDCDLPLIDTITLINNIPGVLATSVVYHHFEDDMAIQEKQL